MPLTLELLDGPVYDGVDGNVVTPAPNALVIGVCVGYYGAFLADPTPAGNADWGAMSWGNYSEFAGHQPYYSWYHTIITGMVWGQAPASPVAGAWRIFNQGSKTVAALFQVRGGVAALDPAVANLGHAHVDGFISGSAGDTHVDPNLPSAPVASSLVVAALGGAMDSLSHWDGTEPGGYARKLSEDSHLYPPAGGTTEFYEYPNFDHTHLQVASRHSTSSALSWGIPLGATAGAIALEVRSTLPEEESSPNAMTADTRVEVNLRPRMHIPKQYA